MDLNKIIKAILFPHIAIMAVLIPVSAVLLIYSVTVSGSETAYAAISYAVSAYTLTVWCLKAPKLIKSFKQFKRENKYARLWQEDIRLRVSISLFGSFIWNTAYAIFQLCLGIVHSSFWFFSLAGYYILLAIMRFFLVLHTKRFDTGEKMRSELKKYRACGMILLLLNMALSVMIFFMVYHNKTFEHYEITTIAMAAYTFTSFTFAVINIVKYRKYNSPVYSASKVISLAASCVSMLTLESTMLTTWEKNEDPVFRRLMLAMTGIAVVTFITVMAINMIKNANKSLNILKEN